MVHYFLKKIASTQYNYSLSRSAIWHRVNTLRKGKRASPWLFLAKNAINEYSGALTKVCGWSIFCSNEQRSFHQSLRNPIPLRPSFSQSKRQSRAQCYGHHHFFAMLDHHCTLFNFLSRRYWNVGCNFKNFGTKSLKFSWH